MNLIGPHNGIELDMMLTGAKPAALLMTYEKYERFLPYVDNGTFIWAMIRNASRSGVLGWSHVFAPAGQEWRIVALAIVYEDVRNSSAMREWHHRIIGKLLGYTDREIITFLERY